MIKNFLMLGTLVFSAVYMTNANAAACSPKKVQEILQPALQGSSKVKVDCSVTLPANASISKQLLFAGARSSGSILDCNGATIQPSFGKLAVLITSVKTDDGWDVPQNIQIKNCTLNSPLRIHGMAANGQGEYLLESSHHEGHTQRAQQAAPHDITLDNLEIDSNGNMIYLAPGVHDVTIKNSRFKANAAGLAVYMDAESANNVIENNTFNVQTKARELIAIDGSANNIIRNNNFIKPINGGIFLYRNCGEGGTIRHQTPSNNQIINNRFEVGAVAGKKPLIWIGSRTINNAKATKSFCNLDDGYAFGSSISNDDLAQNNTIENNSFIQPNASKFALFRSSKAAAQSTDNSASQFIRVDSAPNKVEQNKAVN